MHLISTTTTTSLLLLIASSLAAADPVFPAQPHHQRIGALTSHRQTIPKQRIGALAHPPLLQRRKKFENPATVPHLKPHPQPKSVKDKAFWELMAKAEQAAFNGRKQKPKGLGWKPDLLLRRDAEAEAEAEAYADNEGGLGLGWEVYARDAEAEAGAEAEADPEAWMEEYEFEF